MTTSTTTASGKGYAPADCSAFVRVAAIMPFFRYAVGPTSQHSPAIPYFTRKGAEACFDEVTRELPWAGARIYRRTWGGLVTVREHRPNKYRDLGAGSNVSEERESIDVRTQAEAVRGDARR